MPQTNFPRTTPMSTAAGGLSICLSSSTIVAPGHGEVTDTALIPDVREYLDSEVPGASGHTASIYDVWKPRSTRTPATAGAPGITLSGSSSLHDPLRGRRRSDRRNYSPFVLEQQPAPPDGGLTTPRTGGSSHAVHASNRA